MPESFPLPDRNSAYGSRDYWETRYAAEDSYDWITSYDAVTELIHQHVLKTDRILMIGCGNSPFSRAMYADGYHNITNIDYSSVVIEKENVKAMETGCDKMQYLCMDMLQMSFETASFDVVIDKCTMDALQVDSGDPWNPDESVRSMIHQLCTDIIRILVPNGKLIQMSFQQPHFRRLFVTRQEWEVSNTTFGGGFGYFFYVLKKIGAGGSRDAYESGSISVSLDNR